MFPVSWRSAPLALEHGRGVVIAFTNMTEYRAAELALREHEAERIRAAGLITSHRHDNNMLHLVTALGAALLKRPHAANL